jgi:hypothetical protein
MNPEWIAYGLIAVSVASGLAGAWLLSFKPSQERLEAPVDKTVAEKAKDL